MTINSLAERDVRARERVAEGVYNMLTLRSRMFEKLLDPRRDLNAECGYPVEISTDQYWEMYDRESYAARVVECLPKECWGEEPSVYEDADEEVVTPFEQAFADLGAAIRPTRSYVRSGEEDQGNPVWEVLLRADCQSRIGGYGIIVVGLDDGLPLDQPAQRREGQQVTYLRVFPQRHAPVTRLETDRTSPRYGLPLAYSVTFNDASAAVDGVLGATTATSEVHWTRVVHVADNLQSSEWMGVPSMKRVFNELMDIRKVKASAGEGFWRGVVSLISLETHPQLGGDVDVNQDEVRDMMENVFGGTKRDLVLKGMSAKTLAPTVVDPTPHVQVYVKAICTYLGVPVPVFEGYEIGEQASENNDDTWQGRLNHRRTKYLTPRLIVPFLDLLIGLGCLPEPAEGYVVQWPGSEGTKDVEDSQVLTARTGAMAQYVSGGVETLMTPIDYLTREMGYSQEEADEIIRNAEEAEAERAEEEQALADEQGLLTAPPEGFVDPKQQARDQEVQLAQAKSGGKGGPIPPGKGGGGKPPFGGGGGKGKPAFGAKKGGVK